MNCKQRYEMQVKMGIKKLEDEEQFIGGLVNTLIESLYVPVQNEAVTRVDPERIRMFFIDGGEPINWGDLKCNEVKKFEDGSFLVTIDEASPGGCQTFCEYIEKFMQSWGYTVSVITEW